MSNDPRAKLLERKAKIDARLRALDLAAKKQERKDDTRRKIIAGALILEHASQKEEFARELAKLLNRYVKRPEDRALFDFLNAAAADAPSDEPPAKPATMFGAAVAHPAMNDPASAPQRETA